MKNLAEYNEGITEYELFTHFSERIISREITTFSALKAYAAPVLQSRAGPSALFRGFELIKSLYWGFFSRLSKDSHLKMWHELVIPDKDFPQAGDLKRTMSISNLYVAMLDIHGYTAFCQESRKNLSMLHALDRTISGEVAELSTQCGAVSRRERGDEIVLVSASATDALNGVLSITGYFAKAGGGKNRELSVQSGDGALILPAFKISAGIAGGNTSVPLIITENGELSGFLLNTAARLQARANELSPRESRVMATQHFHLQFDKENAVMQSPLLRKTYFFDTGFIEFKGAMLPTCEVIFTASEKYKGKLAAEMNRLFTSIRESLWERVFLDLAALLAKTFAEMPAFNIPAEKLSFHLKELNNEIAGRICTAALTAYEGEDYPLALNLLGELVKILECCPAADRLILEYAREVAAKYSALLEPYNEALGRQVDDKAEDIFPGDKVKTYRAAKNGADIYQKLLYAAKKSPLLTRKKTVWFNLIKENKKNLDFVIYSGKK